MPMDARRAPVSPIRSLVRPASPRCSPNQWAKTRGADPPLGREKWSHSFQLRSSPLLRPRPTLAFALLADALLLRVDIGGVHVALKQDAPKHAEPLLVDDDFLGDVERQILVG